MSAPRKEFPGGNGNGRPFFFVTDSGVRIDLVAHAHALAHENLPHQDATEPSELEEAIRAEFERQHGELCKATRLALHDELETMRGLEERLPRPEDVDRQLG